MLQAVTFGGLQRVVLLRVREKNGLLMHAPNSAMFSIFFLPLSIFFSFSSFFLSQFLFYYCLAITFGGLQRVGLLRVREKWSIDACPQFCCVFYLLFYYCFCRGSLFSQFSLPSSLRSFLCPP